MSGVDDVSGHEEQPALPGLPPIEELFGEAGRPVVARVPSGPAVLDPRVRRALATLDEQPDLSLVTLANALGITRATLIRIVREATGVTPKQYAAQAAARRTVRNSGNPGANEL